MRLRCVVRPLLARARGVQRCIRRRGPVALQILHQVVEQIAQEARANPRGERIWVGFVVGCVLFEYLG